MKLYFASGTGSDLNLLRNKNVLISYFYSKTRDTDFKQKYNFKSYFIDSGAFSALTQNKNIDIDEYCKWLIKRKGTYDVCAALDVIGDDKASLVNARYMRDKYNLKVIPCFHYGDSWDLLDIYCKEWDYVALGGLVKRSKIKVKSWLDSVFSKYKNHKFHGFGLTSFEFMKRYPWYSVDSSTFIQARAYGEMQTCIGRITVGKKMKPFSEYQLKLLNKESHLFGLDFDKIIDDFRNNNNADGLLQYNIEYFEHFANNIKQTDFTIKQNQLSDFGINISTLKPSQDQLRYDAKQLWMEENYPNTPKELALKLWRHHNT